MAVYKILPEKDTTIYSAYPTTNTGLDQIIEIQNTTSSFSSSANVSRILLTFPTSVIRDVINNDVGNPSNFKAYLKLFVANATSLPDQYTLNVFPVSSSWEVGTGRFLYNPPVTSDCTWIQRSNYVNWATSSYEPDTTGSYLSNNPGGATWYELYEGSQSFVINSTKDTNTEVTDIVGNFYNGNLDNNGFLIKMEDLYEFDNSSSFSLKFFSKDTHTIYAPQLEIRWNDTYYDRGTLTLLTNENTIVTLGNNIGEYNKDTVYRFLVNARQTYPARQFTTVSVYTINRALPSTTYWAIQDLDTGEYVIDFDTTYTRVSCTPTTGNYFDLYMSGLQSERYYKILIKSVFANGSEVVFDNDYTFKINK
jgi:hypothetical protein